ncbi:nuclear transport factor 2 family protein [Salinirubellus sp. GCM10025818]|uniref:nuclear transport factor 2 family protein n=1 Tax=Salinirubellus TaxID=2162630 RepID=UPI0030D0CA23
MDGPSLARAYYRYIDGGEYDELAGLLAEGFQQVRPDRTIEGREAFVRFMREDRPMTDTSHHVEALYVDDGRVAVEGRLVRDDGGELFGFVDTFRFEGDRIAGIRTYTD